VDFRAAAQRLPVSEDLAVAKFKAGDALFVLKDFAGARQNYFEVLNGFQDIPEVAQSLGDRALYQILRADLQLADVAGAESALRQLLRDFPTSDFGDNGQLLAGEAFSDFGQPEKARQVFQDFAKQFPDSPLAPQAELAVARTFERGQDWPAAITNYEGWLAKHPTNALLPQVRYALGRANYQAGRETNALQLFSVFVAQFPTNDLAPLAQWWVADSLYRAGNFVGAETNYEFIYQTPAWKNSNLYYPAQLMAGRAAAGRLGFADAANYLTRLLADTNCPSPLTTQALFAYGGVLMRMDSPDTNRPFANFEMATNVFAQIYSANPTNLLGARAGSELGDCYLQLGALDAATNAYAIVFNSAAADAGLRSRVRVGIGIALEKKAASAPPENRKALLDQALEIYWDVVYDQTADLFWAKKAGLQALPLMTATGAGNVDKFIDRMELLLPQLKDSLEKKRAALKVSKN
jgi:TolA-binding protein